MKHITRLTSLLIIISVILLSGNINTASTFAAGFNSQEALKIYQNKKFAEITAPSYVVYDYVYQQVLNGKEENTRRPVASLVKMMTAYVAYDYISKGQIKLTDEITTSVYAANVPGTTAFIAPGDKFSVKSALYAVVIRSCNDVSVALAEYIAKSESEFVKIMNTYASEMGMSNTKFVDSTGLDDKGYSTAYDMALLSYNILNKHREYLEVSKISYDKTTFKRITDRGIESFELENTNKYLRFVPSSEGLKIGSTLASMYCIAATYEQTGRRLIVVMLGVSDENVMYAETRRAFEYCMAYYKKTVIQEPDIVKEDIKVKNGKQKTVSCEITEEFSTVMASFDFDKIEVKTKTLEGDELDELILEAPLTEGDVIGKAIYTIVDKDADREEVICELDIVLSEDVERAKWYQIFFQWLLEWFGFA